MKIFGTILKILAALAAIAGVVYIVVNYGDKLTAWAKKLLNKIGCCCGCCDEEPIEVTTGAEEVPTEEPVAEEDTLQAEEADFEG